jgi:hypothetical protein
MPTSNEHTPRSLFDPVDPGYTEAVILDGYDLVPEPGKYFSLIDQAAMESYHTLVGEWQTRADHTHASQEQGRTPLHDGLGVHYQEITLYHGGATHGITKFEIAEEATIGSGLYATSMPDQAFG